MRLSIIASSVLFAVATSSSSANEPTFSAERLMEVQNTCIVKFDDSISRFDVEGRARGMVASANAIARHVYKLAMKGFAMNMNCEQAKAKLGHVDGIASFTPDGLVFANPKGGKPGNGGGGSDPQTTPVSVTRVGGPVDGSGHTAWVLDTGIDLDHADLNVDASRGFSAFTKGKNASMDDGNGHGTHVAGTIGALDNEIDVVGVAAGATVVPVKVLDSRGSGSFSGVIAGIEHVAANASPGDCANMSLGGGFSSELNEAVENAAQQSGAFFVVAAGNEAQHASNVSPASASHNRVYTISAVDSNDRFASFSNYGNPPVDYAAPGVSILSTAKGGGTRTMSGTSMASPAACAVIMMRNGNPGTDGRAIDDPDGNRDPIVHL
ncbi:S8 family serine peptidase [Pleionea sp. CnH1-48]|uniref:S8 family serine peptidase n=1 Tax=Pleionea sp. CnH1-48 TaxID=2954494 RepID=UPI002096D169|nr:S8 family serine peptidase [Pleionea sp. CnH1-48]MCO7224149.1 S8 family serine peptidase [Pleionea sp. CnH1-48]